MLCKVAGMRCVIKGQDMYLEAQKQVVGRVILRGWFWKTDLETVEKNNGVGK